MSNDPKNPNPEEMTMASEADRPKPKDGEEFGEQGTMASESGTNGGNTIDAPRPVPMQQTMASMPGTTSNTGPGVKHQGGMGNFVAEDLIGTELNSYKIIRKIAEGGMGVVLLGEHSLIGRRGAIKVLKPEFCQDEAVVQRFYQEGRAVNAIQHENIVDIYDFGRMDNGGVYFIMEFLDGEPLSSRLEKGPIPFAESLPILEQTLRALKAAHDKGFIHRDLKPDNIFLVKRDGVPHVKILDFGIAKLAGLESAQEKLTRTGSIIGTPHYMSPEQIEGSEVDIRTDIYAMGIIMYEIWTGDTPFKGETLGQVIKGHLMIQAPRLENLKPDLRVPGRVAEIVAKSLEKDRDKRFANSAELLAEIQAASKMPFTPIEAKPAGEEGKTAPVVNRPTKQKSQQQLAQEAKADTTLSTPTPKKSSPVPIIIGVGAAAALGAVLLWPKGNPEKPVGPGGVVVTAVGVCGDGRQEGKETCDDGNKKAGDGCNEECVVEVQKKCPDDLDDCNWKDIRAGKWALLRNSINEEKPEVRILGVDALGDLKDKKSAVDLLAKLESDADNQVKAEAARSLAEIGDTASLAKLQELAKTAEGPLKVWLVDAAAQLGDPTATKALEKLVNDAVGRINAAVRATKPVAADDIAIVLDGGVALAKLSKPGNTATIELLRKIALLGSTISTADPTAGPRIAGQMARLGDATSRKTLQGFLSHEDEGIRITAAEQLANLGDDSGKATLTTSLTSDLSANQLAAARILVTLGDYSGYDILLSEYQKSKDEKIQQIAVEGLARIAERDSLRFILPRSEGDASWVIKIPSAVAVLMISGLDPAVLTQASVDWVSASLQSNDVTARVAAVKLIGDLPKKQATDLFLSAVAAPDPDPKVRKALLAAGGKIQKSPEVTKAIVLVAMAEKDPGVKETGVKALGNTKDVTAIDPLKTDFLPQGGRVGVFAAGALVELGAEADGKPVIQAALLDPKLKGAAIEALFESENQSLINEMLAPVTSDKVVDIRFMAAEAIATYAPNDANKSLIQPVLEEGIKLKDPAIQARAVAALAKIGVDASPTMTIEEYLASPDVEIRKAALPLVAAKGGQDGIRYTRLLLADAEQDIRGDTLSILEGYVGPNRENIKPVVNMLKVALEDSDEGVRNKAQLLIAKIAPDGIATSKDVAPKPLTEATPATPAVCGDGKMEGAEECDDTNTAAGDGCDATCKKEIAAAVCGNGKTEDGEDCDDTNTTAGDGCSDTCKTEAVMETDVSKSVKTLKGQVEDQEKVLTPLEASIDTTLAKNHDEIADSTVDSYDDDLSGIQKELDAILPAVTALEEAETTPADAKEDLKAISKKIKELSGKIKASKTRIKSFKEIETNIEKITSNINKAKQDSDLNKALEKYESSVEMFEKSMAKKPSDSQTATLNSLKATLDKKIKEVNAELAP